MHVSESIYILHIQDTLADRFYAILLTVWFLSVVCLEEKYETNDQLEVSLKRAAADSNRPCFSGDLIFLIVSS